MYEIKQSIWKKGSNPPEDNCYIAERDGEQVIVLATQLSSYIDESAAAVAVSQFQEDYQKQTAGYPIQNFLYHEARCMDQKVSENSERGKASLTAAIIREDRLHILSVGNTRLYLRKNKNFQCLTRIHNYKLILDQLYRAGKISREQYEEGQSRQEDLVSFLGIGNIIIMDVLEYTLSLSPGDQWVICSPDIVRNLTDEQIEAVMEDNDFDAEIMAIKLSRTASEYARGQDGSYSCIAGVIKS